MNELSITAPPNIKDNMIEPMLVSLWCLWKANCILLFINYPYCKSNYEDCGGKQATFYCIKTEGSCLKEIIRMFTSYCDKKSIVILWFIYLLEQRDVAAKSNLVSKNCCYFSYQDCGRNPSARKYAFINATCKV